MNDTRRVLIITGSAGGGHVSAACALEEKAAELGLECKTVDALNASRFFRFSTQNLYEAFVRIAPRLWGAFYDLLERNKTALSMHTRFTTANLSQLEGLIKDYRPHWIICTHDVALPKLATLRRYPHTFQLAVTVTDVHPHILWIEGSAAADAELIFVSCCESKEDILQRSRIPSNRIIVSGIPIGSSFSKPRLLTTGFDKKRLPVILITSGMIGAGRYLDVLKSLAHLKTRVKVVIVCGRNEKIFRKLNKLAKNLKKFSRHEYDIRCHVDRVEMSCLMHECTMLVAKPGGLTMSEALAAGCPFVIYEPFLIPGQEQKNAQFLLDNEIGVRAESAVQLRTMIDYLLANRDQLRKLSANGRAHGKPHAACEILQKMLEMEDLPAPAAATLSVPTKSRLKSVVF